MDKSKYEGNIWKVFVIYAIAGLGFLFITVAVLYYQSFDLNYSKIGIVLGVGMLSTILLEVPSGAFADLYGRKKSINIGLFLFFLGILMISGGSHFYWFIFAAVIFGAGNAFLSGSWEALLYDSIKKIGKEKDYLQITARQEATFLGVSIFSSFFGPYLFSLNIRYPYYAAAITAFTLFLFSLFLYEPATWAKELSFNKHLSQMKSGFTYVKGNILIVWLIGFSIVTFVVWRVFGELMSAPFIIAKGFSLQEYAVISLFISLIQAVIAFLSSKIEGIIQDKLSFIFIVVGISSMLILALITNNYMIALVVGIMSGITTFQLLVVRTYINNIIEEKIRATVISIHSMIASLVGSIFMVVFGVILDKTTMDFTVLVLTIFLVIFGTFFIIIRYNKRIWKNLSKKRD